MRARKPHPSHSPFTSAAIKAIRAIPEGKVATYGQIAKIAGNSRASRGVSWILASCTRLYGLPWQRVLGGRGMISIPWGSPAFQKQRRLLRQEGVAVGEDGTVDMKTFQWKRGL